MTRFGVILEAYLIGCGEAMLKQFEHQVEMQTTLEEIASEVSGTSHSVYIFHCTSIIYSCSVFQCMGLQYVHALQRFEGTAMEFKFTQA